MPKIIEEKRIVESMIRLYCLHYEGNKNLCEDCAEILNYAFMRLEKCPYRDNKPTCRKCAVHCYKPEMRQKIKNIMAWAGPRMFLYHPIYAVKHIIREL